MIYFYDDEVKPICAFLGANFDTVWKWLEANRDSNKYLEFHKISDGGASMYTLVYGRNHRSTERQVCQVSSFGTVFVDTQE